MDKQKTLDWWDRVQHETLESTFSSKKKRRIWLLEHCNSKEEEITISDDHYIIRKLQELFNKLRDSKIVTSTDHNNMYMIESYVLAFDQLIENSNYSKLKGIKQEFDKINENLKKIELYITNQKKAATSKNKNRITKKERTFILERDNYTCKNCKKKLERKRLHIDHIIPKISGGSNNPSNLQTLCIECNLIKRDSDYRKRALQNTDNVK